MGVGEVLLVMLQAPLRHDRPASRDNPGYPPRRHRDVAQQHAGVHREVIHPLLCLLDQRVAIDLPGQLFRTTIDLLQRLVDRHGADRHRRVADDPFARCVDVRPGRQVHHRVGPPERGPSQLLDLFLDRRRHRRVPDVGVDLDEKVPADRHRLELWMVDVGRDDGAPTRHFVAHELGCKPFAHGHEFHFLGHRTPSRVV